MNPVVTHIVLFLFGFAGGVAFSIWYILRNEK